MKIFGRQGDSYIISIHKDELMEIVFGQRHVTYSKVKNDAEEFIKDCNHKEVEVSISKVFTKMIELHNTDLYKNYDGLVAKIEAIKSLLIPIGDYIKSSSEKAKQQE
jgi:hypothetical protein